MRPYPSAAPVTVFSCRQRTARTPLVSPISLTSCISDVPGLAKQVSSPASVSALNNACAPFIVVSPFSRSVCGRNRSLVVDAHRHSELTASCLALSKRERDGCQQVTRFPGEQNSDQNGFFWELLPKDSWRGSLRPPLPSSSYSSRADSFIVVPSFMKALELAGCPPAHRIVVDCCSSRATLARRRRCRSAPLKVAEMKV